MKQLTILLFSFLSILGLPESRITIFLAGDSTMAEKLPERRPETGWGEKFRQFFDPESVLVENHAKNGRSTRTFIAENRWSTIVEHLKEGNYVFIQFGHNDSSPQKADRYTPPEQFRSNLVRFVKDAREKKATPVLLTPVVRRRFDVHGVFYDTHGEYPDIVRSVAADERVALIDLHRKTEDLLKRYGVTESARLFLHLKAGENPNYPDGIEDNTHFSPLGAELVARLAVEEIKNLKLDLSVHLKTP